MSRPARVRALFLVVATLTAGGVASPAAAHRDGCHRWHSCPSDSGSYVCGDLGYYSECPGGRPGTTAPPVYVDYQAPDAPTVGTASARAGLLSVPVVAERGSRLAVTIDGAAFGRYVATGVRQVLRFRARHGSHTYTVTATDAAGNDSDAAEFTLDVDAQAPERATVRPELPGERGGHTVLVLDGEADALYSVSVARGGRDVRALRRVGYLDATGGARVELLAPNGPYAATVRVRDRAGNAAPAVRTAFRVAIPQPALTVERTTPPTSSDAAFRVTGPALALGELTLRSAGLPDVRLPFTLSSLGGADVSTRLADGTWSADVTATDFQRRRATAQATGVVVDTVAPVLTVASDLGAAEDRTIDLLVNASEGVTTVSGLPGGPVTLSEAGEHRIQRRVEDGRYEIRVEAADLAGNRTTRDLVVSVTHPLTAAEAVTALVMLALLLLGGWFGWRRRAVLVRGYRRYRTRAANQAHPAAVAPNDGALPALRRADDALRTARGAWTAGSAEFGRLARQSRDARRNRRPRP